MQDIVSVDKLDDVRYKISIMVSPENVESKFDSFFDSVKKEAHVPGFRKGKAPISRLKQYYHNHAQPTVANMLLTEYYSRAVKDNEIDPVGAPEFNESSKNKFYGVFNADKSYSVNIIIEAIPKFVPTGYVGLKIKCPMYNDELLFDTKMSEYREKFAERKQIFDRGAQNGNSLVIDFTGFLDDEPFEGGAAEGFTVDKLGAGSLIPGFEKQIIGMSSGETKSINVNFPNDYKSANLAGREVRFDITVHSIVESTLAEIDDELALLSGFSDVGEMETSIHNDIKAYKANNNRHISDKQIIDQLLEINKFSIPKSMADDEKKRLIGKNTNVSLPDNVKEELETVSTRNVKRAILIDRIYEAEEDIEVTPEILSEVLEKQAKQSGQTKDELVSALYNSGKMDSFVGELRETNVIDFIISNAVKENNE